MKKKLITVAGEGKRAALYIRRSTEEHQQQSLEVQEEQGRKFIADRGWSLRDEHVFVDSGISRAEFKNRPAIWRMLAAAKRREVTVVVTRDETRLGGDMHRTGLFLSDLFEAGAEVFYYSTGEKVAVADVTGRLMVVLKGYAAELEREKTSQRTHEHLLTKARKGLNVGGRVYGYDNREVKNGEHRQHVEYAINDEQAAVVREIFERYASGQGLRAIARELNGRGVPSARAGRRGTGSWAPSAIFSIIRRGRYIGAIEWNRSEKAYRGGTKVRLEREDAELVRVDAPHLRIVPQELWLAVQRQIQGNVKTASGEKARKGGRTAKYLLAGIARCGVCGGPLTVVNTKAGTTTVPAYSCKYHHDRGQAVCTNKQRRPMVEMDAAVLEWIQAHVLSEELLVATLQKLRARLKTRVAKTADEVPVLEKRIAKLRAEIANIVDILTITPKDQAGHLVTAMAERNDELRGLEARVSVTKAAPDVISFEVRRMEAEAAKLLANLRKAAALEPAKARAFLTQLFDGGTFTATPVETLSGPRLRLEGRASLQRMRIVEGGLVSNHQPPPKYASPAGFEPA
jgi:site-specific DNA recombinase